MRGWLSRVRFDLKSKIILFFVAFTLGMSAVIIVYMSDQYNRIILENINQNNKKMVESVDYYFEDVKTPMVMIARSDIVRTAMKDYNNLDTAQQVDILNGLNDFVKNIATFKEFISDIIIIGSDGYSYNIYNSDTGKYLKEYDFLNSEYLEEARSGNIRLYYLGEHPTDYYIHSEEDSMVYSVVLPVKQSKRIIGYVMCDIYADVIDEILQQNGENGKSSMVVFDDRENVIYEQGTAKSKKNIKTRIVRDTGAADPDLLKILFSDDDYITCDRSEVTGWTYAYAEPYSSFNEFVKKIIITGAVALMIGIGIIILFLRQLSGEVLTPLKNIAAMIRDMKVNQGSGELPSYRSSGKSIGELSVEIEKMIQRTDALVNRVYVSELKAKDAQIQVMASQLSPHFLYNTLQLIEYQSQKNQQENVTKIICGLSYILRYSINNTKSEVRLKEETAYVEAYLEIYSLRLQGQLSCEILLDPAVEDCLVLKMLLQPLAENCIRHGFAGRRKDLKIKISVYGQEGVLAAEVWDNGNGISEEELLELREKYCENPRSVLCGASSLAFGTEELARLCRESRKALDQLFYEDGRFYLTYREKNQAEEASIQIEENQFLLWILNGESENWKKALDEMAEALRRRCVSREAAVKKFAEVKDIAARVASDRQQTEKLEELSLKMERACRMTELKNLAGDCIEVVNTTGIKGKKNRKLILNAREYMKEHFFEETFSMDLLAEHLAISKSYLSKVYKEETGESVWTYVIRLRIAKAKEMLAGSDATG